MKNTPRGRATPPPAEPPKAAPTTLPEVIARLQDELAQTEADSAYYDAELRRTRERAAYLRGRIESYASITLIEHNPATIEHDQE